MTPVRSRHALTNGTPFLGPLHQRRLGLGVVVLFPMGVLLALTLFADPRARSPMRGLSMTGMESSAVIAATAVWGFLVIINK